MSLHLHFINPYLPNCISFPSVNDGSTAAAHDTYDGAHLADRPSARAPHAPLDSLHKSLQIKTIYHRHRCRHFLQRRHPRTPPYKPHSPPIDRKFQDFRSEDGLYNLVKAKYPKSVIKGKDLFDVSLFMSPVTTSIFFTFIASLRQRILAARPTVTHQFIRAMHERGKLVRCYTQNIDGIEESEGLMIGGKTGQVCQLHGDIHTLRCDYCNTILQYTLEWTEMLLEGEAPECPDCTTKCNPPPL